MRLLALSILAFALLAFSKKGEHPERFIFDHENALDAEQEMRLDTLFRGHELRTTNEFVLITTHDYHGAPDMASFAGTCGDSLRVGKKHKNNGVVITFSKHLREVYIAPGLGMEHVLTDDRCKRIIDSLMLPLFKENMYFDGLWEGGRAMVYIMERPENRIR